jgi:putative aldouronate transport system permease protein
VDFTFNDFKVVFGNKMIYTSMLISVMRTVFGTLYTIIVTGLASYSISRRYPGRRMLSILLIIPMYISGGMIPYYVVLNRLGLFNNFFVYILPLGFSAYYMLLMRTFFEGVPESLHESARLDGAGELMIFVRIIVPLSMPILATIAMFAGVFQWNSWFDGMVYVSRPQMRPMATMIQEMLHKFEVSDLRRAIEQQVRDSTTSPESVKMATIVVSSVPIICVYPFLQKYFIKGVMIGAVKA